MSSNNTQTGNNPAENNLAGENTATNSKVDVGKLMQGIGGLGSAAATAYSTYANVQGADNIINQANAARLNSSVGTNSFDDWTQAYLNNRSLEGIGLKDVGFNSGKAKLNVASTALQGAAAGAALGPWGALAGGVIGLAGGLFGYSAAKKKAEKNARLGNSAIVETNAYNNALLNNNLMNLKDRQYNDLAASYIAAEGGVLQTQGSDWNTGLNYIGAGGSHEQNPNGGIQQGIAPDGLPNLVEEGEVIWNGDYVFSKRLKVPKAVRNKYKLRGTKPMSFADAALEFNKEMDERPNDPISKRGRDGMLAKLADAQEEKRAKIQAKEQAQQAAMMDMMGMPQDQMAMQEPVVPEEQPVDEMAQGMPMVEGYAAKGGPIGHKYPYGTKLQFVPEDSDWLYSVPTFQWSDEVNPDNRRRAITDYILNMAKDSPDDYNKLIQRIGGNALNYKDNPQGLIDFAYSNKSGRERTPKTDPVYYGIWGSYNRNAPDRESLKIPASKMPGLATPPINGNLQINSPGSRWNKLRKQFTTYPQDTQSNYPWQGYLRYAPAIGSAIGVFSDLMGWTNKPDYSAAEAIANASRNVRDVSFRPIGDYAKYMPVDRMMALNQLNAAASASRRAISNTSGGNRGTALAGILASDNNYMNNIGNTLFSAENANYDRYMKALAHNTDVNKFNSEGFLKAAMANQGAGEVRAKYAALAADARQKALALASANRSANLTNLFDNLGNIGIDALNRADARWLAQFWKGANAPSSAKCGGRINKRRRRRII